MEYSLQEKIDNAVKWIDALPSYKQAPYGHRARLGDETRGFCCLGVGCHVLDMDYDPSRGISKPFQHKVGLTTDMGGIGDGLYYGRSCLTQVNDSTKAGFKRIAKFIKNNPEKVFDENIAEGIKEHYNLK